LITFIDLKERFEYVSPFDTTEPKTIFVLRNLPSSAKAKGFLEYSENMQIESMFSTLKSAIVEIKNGADVIKDITPGLLDTIPVEVLTGVYNCVIERNILTKDDEKN